ncbi:MAG: hypothetical protein J5I50_08700 [Chitinophagaceae bacterium]|nr:hypothetical protein [Chitinophagaceae bacterium]
MTNERSHLLTIIARSHSERVATRPVWLSGNQAGNLFAIVSNPMAFGTIEIATTHSRVFRNDVKEGLLFIPYSPSLRGCPGGTTKPVCLNGNQAGNLDVNAAAR